MKIDKEYILREFKIELRLMDKIDDLFWIRGYPKFKNSLLKKIEKLLVDYKKNEETKKWLEFYREDILGCFKPKCTCCNRLATRQTERGRSNQKNLSRPVNWGYYCEACWKKGVEMENEAMHGN